MKTKSRTCPHCGYQYSVKDYFKSVFLNQYGRNGNVISVVLRSNLVCPADWRLLSFKPLFSFYYSFIGTLCIMAFTLWLL